MVQVSAPFFATPDFLAQQAFECFKVRALPPGFPAQGSCRSTGSKHLTSLQAYLPPHISPDTDQSDPWAAAWFSAGAAVVTGRQIPLGVLAPFLSPPGELQRAWSLEVHFTQQWPQGVSPLQVPTEARARVHLLCNARHMFFNTLKEAVFMRTGVGLPTEHLSC